jgi:hypothetical protein
MSLNESNSKRAVVIPRQIVATSGPSLTLQGGDDAFCTALKGAGPMIRAAHFRRASHRMERDASEGLPKSFCRIR